MKYLYTIILLLLFQGLQAQCYPDRHNTNWFDAWTSCTPSPNPNTTRGDGHWILYNLGHLYELKDSKFWNANHPDFLQDGLKDVVIDYSVDGINWEEWGTFTLPMATGDKTYEGSTGPDFTATTARYVLITAMDNHGGNCYSMSELKINVDVAPLAVAWSPLAAQARETDIQLSWTTYQEKDHAGFEIQRSIDGQYFQKIDWIAGGSDSQQQKAYQFLDKKVQANILYYYRLKQIDEAGKSDFSNTATAQLNGKATPTIFPNPVQDVLYFQWSNLESLALQVEVTDVLGKVIQSQELSETTEQGYAIAVGNLMTGTYFLRIHKEGSVHSLRFIKK